MEYGVREFRKLKRGVVITAGYDDTSNLPMEYIPPDYLAAFGI